MNTSRPLAGPKHFSAGADSTARKSINTCMHACYTMIPPLNIGIGTYMSTCLDFDTCVKCMMLASCQQDACTPCCHLLIVSILVAMVHNDTADAAVLS